MEWQPAAQGVRTGSASWQRDAGDPNLNEGLVAYLEEMAADPFIQHVARLTLSSLQLQPGERVLEVGCGAGAFLKYLAQAVGATGRVSAIDHNPAMVAAAQERVQAQGLDPHVTIEAADAYALPFPDGSFDAAHCERVLMHLDDPEAALREMRRVVRPGGRIVAAEPNWYGMQVDHPDHEAMELLLQRHFTRVQRQPRIGLELNRHMAEVGLVERRIVSEIFDTTTPAGIARYGFDSRETAEQLVAEGSLSHDRVDALFAYLDEASREQRFYAQVTAVIGRGNVPAAD